jgi:5-oxoprolinase (ATP-hydrolysing) subunit C
VTASLTVHRAGIAAVTDLGRPGHTRRGIPANGAADQYSATVANLLAGNAAAAPLIEVTATAFTFTASRRLWLAVTGAPCTLTVGGDQRPQWTVTPVPAGEPVALTAIHTALRCYVAVSGRLTVPRVLGSCAPDPLLGAGGWLRAGDRIPFQPTGSAPPPRTVTPPDLCPPWTVDVTDGPESEHFDTTLYEATYRLTPDSNHIGLRLAGPAPANSGPVEVRSRGVPAGAVEVPPAGAPIVLMRGRPVTAGYPVPAVATRTAQSVLAQIRPGQQLRFRRRTLDQAVAAYRAQRPVPGSRPDQPGP